MYKLEAEIMIHRDKGGSPKKTDDGKYRFDILFKREEEGVMVVRGFRLPVSGIKMLMPASKMSHGGLYEIIQMEAGFEKEIKDFVKSEVGMSIDEDSEDEPVYFKKKSVVEEKKKEITDEELYEMDVKDVPNELMKRWDKLRFPDSN